MSLPASVARTLRTVADWLDDRLTIAAVGLATGYFGLGQAQWDSLTGLIVAFASAVLVLVPDPRKSESLADEPPPPPIVVPRAADPVNWMRVQSDRELSDGPDDPGHNG